MSDDWLKPWQRLPRVACERCPAQVTRRVTATDGEVAVGIDERGDPVLILVNETTRTGALACEEHAAEIAAEFCDRFGASNSVPLRYPWRYWLESRFCLARKWVGR